MQSKDKALNRLGDAQCDIGCVLGAQVFNYIMQTLTKYRQLHQKGSVLLRGSTSPQDAGPPSHAASPFAGHDGLVSLICTSCFFCRRTVAVCIHTS